MHPSSGKNIAQGPLVHVACAGSRCASVVVLTDSAHYPYELHGYCLPTLVFVLGFAIWVCSYLEVPETWDGGVAYATCHRPSMADGTWITVPPSMAPPRSEGAPATPPSHVSTNCKLADYSLTDVRVLSFIMSGYKSGIMGTVYLILSRFAACCIHVIK